MEGNVFVFPTFGKPITLDDEGIYYTLNAKTGLIQCVIQLIYKDEWYLYQLRNVPYEEEAAWSILAEEDSYELNSMTTEQIRRTFSKPEYSEPRGAWQALKNSKYGIGKFTPLNPDDPVSYAFLMFEGNEMHAPMLIHKAEENLHILEDMPMYAVAEFA
ncbi:MAG: hypothetical protein ACKVOA_10120 [Methylophilaceae bacterium]